MGQKGSKKTADGVGESLTDVGIMSIDSLQSLERLNLRQARENLCLVLACRLPNFYTLTAGPSSAAGGEVVPTGNNSS